MSTDNRVKILQDKHAEIDAEIQELVNTSTYNNVTDLKKAKLAIKDEIQRLQKEVGALAT